MKHLKRNLGLLFICDTLLLIVCLTFTIQKFIHHPQMSFGLIALLIVDFIVLSTFCSLLTIAVQYIIKKIKERKQQQENSHPDEKK